MVIIHFLFVILSSLSIAVHHDELASAFCGQLGCDYAGLFTQDRYKLQVDNNRSLAWASKQKSVRRMTSQNENYGCVGSSQIVVCPYHSDADGGSRHIMLDTDTGEEYNTSDYETLENIGMPVLTKENLVFAVNGSHASLVDPLNNRSFMTTIPTKNPQGVHSPLYLPDLGFLVVFGNLSLNHSIYKVEKDLSTGHPILNLVTAFTVGKVGEACPWLIFSEAVAQGNRAYVYSYFKDGTSGVIALDFFSDAPYYRKVWRFPPDGSSSNSLQIHKWSGIKKTENCTMVPETDPEYTKFPPIDVYLQLLATPDRSIVITTAVTLMTLKDLGETCVQAGLSLFGAHFLSFDSRQRGADNPSVVWMTGWQQYKPFRTLLSAHNYTNAGSTNSNWYIALNKELGMEDLNVTSRITSYPDPEDKSRRVLVFGVRVNNTNTASPFHTKYCPQCKLGINNMLMAVRSSPTSTAVPDIVWITSVPLSPGTMEIRGQIIGLSEKLIMYISDGDTGNIIAFK